MPKTRHYDRSDRKQTPSEPNVPPLKESVHPGTDFYNFVNGNWLQDVSIPSYMSSYGVSEEVEEIIHKECLEILSRAQTLVHNTPDKSIPREIYLLGTLTESALNKKSQMLNVNYIRSMVSQFQCTKDINDLGHLLGQCCKYKIPNQISIHVKPMNTESSIYRLTIGIGSVGLPDPSYYTDSTPEKLKTLEKYSKLLQSLGKDFTIDGLEQIIGIEKISAQILIQAEKDEEELIHGSTLLHNYPHIPWLSIVASAMNWTETKFRSQSILVLSKHWLVSLDKWFKSLPISQWKLWISANLLLYILPLLPPPYSDMQFELFGHVLKGQQKKIPQKQLALALSEQWLTGSLGKLFVQSHVTSEIKESAEHLAKRIRTAASHKAGLTSWLDAKTQKIARSKVQHIHLNVAYPSRVVSEHKVQLNPEQLVENVLKLAEAEFLDDLDDINKPLNIYKWDDAVFAVNAYYYNEGNRLILPSGILRWPFFHPLASDGWNYGGLGNTIGHEISHAFDNDGKDYDDKGNKHQWWSKAEIEHYHKKTKALIELYSSTDYFGQKLNGYLTLSENIADLGGMDIALMALKERFKEIGASPEDMKKHLRDFFIAYAVSWRTKEKKEKALQSLFMDVHAPPPARVNNIVCQFDEWYEAFDIHPGDKLYRDPHHRIRIF